MDNPVGLMQKYITHASTYIIWYRLSNQIISQHHKAFCAAPRTKIKEPKEFSIAAKNDNPNGKRHKPNTTIII